MERKGYLTDDQGTPSSMRLMSLMALVASIVFGFLVVTQDQPTAEALYLVVAFLLSAFAPKVAQKYLERGINPSPKA